MMRITKKTLIVVALVLLSSSVNADSSKGIGSFTVTKDSSNNNEATVPKPIFKPAVTRTELKVSRSLNPDNVQTLNVRTNNGGLATIIVKKRDGKTSVNNEPRQAYYDVSNQFSRGEVRRGLFGPVQVLERLDDSQIQTLHQQQQQFENGRVYNNWAGAQPVTTLHQSQLYHRNPYESYRFSPPSPNDQKSVDLINSFMKHVQQFESNRQVRSPDSSIPNDRAQIHTKIPEPVTINSESVYVKDQNNKKARSLLEIDTDGIPLINGVRVPDDENDKRQTWRNARVINGELVPYENGYIPPRTVEYGQLIYPVKKGGVEEIQSRRKSIGPFSKLDNFSEESEDQQDSNKSIGPFSVRDMFTSRSNEQSPSDGNIGPFSVADNSRTSNSKLIDYIKRINDQEFRKDYFAGRSPKEAATQPKIQRRMLTPPGNGYFPPSTKYSTNNKPNDSNLVGPVLQYAHPEFGLQSVGSNHESEQQAKNKQSARIDYYTNNYQQRPNAQPVYQIEPATLNTREYYNYQKAPATYPYNYGFIRRVKPERPFWMKISEQVRDTFQNGFSQVQEITRPVMDPIMEAGEKISQNLGFSYPQQNQVAQEKVSSIVPGQSGSSYIFPALGMLAGGAALGLGAVAMGRIFDVGSLLAMRSADGHISLEHKRALEAINKAPTTTLFLVENNEVQSENSLRSNIGNYNTDSINVYATPTSASPKAKFIELIAIPYHRSIDSSIEPSSEQSQLASHQRRKRNK